MTEEYSFCIQGSHRQTTVIGEDLLSAAKDAAQLLDIAEHERLLWLPPLPPSGSQTHQHMAPAPREHVVEQNTAETTKTMTLDVVSIGRACFPIFLKQAEQHWQHWQGSQESNQEAMVRYSMMICGAIDAIFSAKALEQVCSHLMNTSGGPREMMAPTFEVTLEHLESLQRPCWHLVRDAHSISSYVSWRSRVKRFLSHRREWIICVIA